MKLLFAFGWIPVPVFYVKRLFADGFSPLVFVLIKEKSRSDEALHQHELEHIKQAYRLALLPYAILYLLSKRYRLWAEVKAYRVQIKAGLRLDSAAWYLSKNYRLGITQDEAKAYLEERASGSS